MNEMGADAVWNTDTSPERKIGQEASEAPMSTAEVTHDHSGTQMQHVKCGGLARLLGEKVMAPLRKGIQCMRLPGDRIYIGFAR